MSDRPNPKSGSGDPREEWLYPEWLVEALGLEGATGAPQREAAERAPGVPESKPAKPPAAGPSRPGGVGAKPGQPSKPRPVGKPGPAGKPAAGGSKGATGPIEGIAAIGNGDSASDWQPRRRHVYKGFESNRVPPHGFRCKVTIELDGKEHVGVAEGREVPGVRAEIAARATLDAIEKAERKGIALALQGARVLRVFDRPVVVAGVYGLNGQHPRSLVGVCLVKDSVEQASVLATLQATDRWIAWEASKRAEE
jgi:hypothetical protein